MLLKVRKNFRYFKSTGYLHGLANGEICVFHGYSVDMFQVMAIIEETKSDVKVEYTIPKEGSIIYFDTLAIPSDAPNADTAHKWIDHILDPQVAANLSNASEFETNLLNGLDSEVGSHGIRLSRGQRQRSILARTLLRSRQKLVLDESINAVLKCEPWHVQGKTVQQL